MKVTIQNYNVDGDKDIHVRWMKLTPEYMVFQPSYHYREARSDLQSDGIIFKIPVTYPLHVFVEVEDYGESICVDLELREGTSHVIYPTLMYLHNINDHVKEFFNKYSSDYMMDYSVSTVGLDISYDETSMEFKWDCTTSVVVPEVSMKFGKYTFTNGSCNYVKLDEFIDSGEITIDTSHECDITNGSIDKYYRQNVNENVLFPNQYREQFDLKDLDDFESFYNEGLPVSMVNDSDSFDMLEGFEIRISNR